MDMSMGGGKIQTFGDCVTTVWPVMCQSLSKSVRPQLPGIIDQGEDRQGIQLLQELNLFENYV